MLARMPGDTAGGLGTLPEDWPRDTFSRPTDGGKGPPAKEDLNITGGGKSKEATHQQFNSQLKCRY